MKTTRADLASGGGWMRVREESPVVANTIKRCTNPLLGETDPVPHGENGKAEKIASVATARMSATMKSTGPTKGIGVKNDTVPAAKGQGMTIKALIPSSSKSLMNQRLPDQGPHHVTGGTTRNDLTVEEVHHHNRAETGGVGLPSDHPARKQMVIQLPKLRHGILPLVMIPIPSKSL
jgi:hypothetical protein